MYKKYFRYTQNDYVYLDSAATTLRLDNVIDAVNEYYTKYNANAGRGSHKLAINSTNIIENTREKVKQFIGAEKKENIVFVKNSTEALNIIAYCYALDNLKKGDEIIIAVSNHHANIIPWQYVAKQKGVILNYVELDFEGKIDLNDFEKKINNNTKLVAISYVVNVTGIENDVKEIVRLSKKYNAITVVDAAQSIPHFKHNLLDIGCDFLVFSAHKMYSVFGCGILYVKENLFEKMKPFIYGGNMIQYVDFEESIFLDKGYKFEGSTIDISSIYALSSAIDFYNNIGYLNLKKYIDDLYFYTINKLSELEFIDIYNNIFNNNGIIAFNVKQVHSHDVSEVLSSDNICIRSGHHCASILLKHMRINSCCRLSIGIYNTREDIDKFIDSLKKVKDIFL